MHNKNKIGRREAIKGLGAGLALFSAPSIFAENSLAATIVI